MHLLTVPLVATSGQWLQVQLHRYGSRPIIQFPIFQCWYSSNILICKSSLIISTLGKVPPVLQHVTRWPVQVFHTLPQRMDESPQQSSLLFISDYAACVHYKWLNAYTMSALLKRRLVQRCCNFCQRCCLLYMPQLFIRTLCVSKRLALRCCNHKFTLHSQLYSQTSCAQYVWRHWCTIAKENDGNANYQYSWKVPIWADTDYWSNCWCNNSIL